MNSLFRLHQTIDERGASIRKAHPDWLCGKGCDACCKQLAALPQLTRAEWEWLHEGLATLPTAQRAEIHRRIATLGPTPLPPVTCPLLDPASGACPVYAHRPVACRTYGFYVQRDKGLHCDRIMAQVERGELADVIWGNHLAVEDDLARLGEVRSLAAWISAPSPVGDGHDAAPMPARHRHR